MTFRTITEIRDTGLDGDTITTIQVAPASVYVEITWAQYPLGEWEKSKEQACSLEYADAVALRNALTAAIEEARKNRRRKR